jgi:adenylate cyclase
LAKSFDEELNHLLLSENITEEEKQVLKALLDEYTKVVRRNEKIIRKSDRINFELEKQKEKFLKLSQRLSKYISPQIYKIVFSEEETKISSKRKKITVFFSDIENFTATTEELESEELTNLLNYYLTEMNEIAFKYGATVDKFIGDAIVIFFGDPETLGYREDAQLCVKMAIEMRDRVAQIEREFINDGIVESFKIRIGIHTGYVTVGNFGSDRRLDYTIIGNGVNLASRLESIAEHDTILISHETFSLVKDIVHTTKEKPVFVKGISKEVQTYKVERLKTEDEIYFEALQIKINSLKMISDKNELVITLRNILNTLE